MIKATAAAIPHLKRILGNYKAVFFGASGGGCNGFKYILQPTNTVAVSYTHLRAHETGRNLVCRLLR